MNERLHALASQIEAAAAEKLQREAENLQLEQQAVDFAAERNASQAREGLLQFEKDQLRARLAEIDELLRTPARFSTRLATAGVSCRQPPQSCRLMPCTWRIRA